MAGRGRPMRACVGHLLAAAGWDLALVGFGRLERVVTSW